MTLDRFDDFPIHQTPEPIARPASSDRNVYDRYWLNGFDRDAGFYFGIALGLYPHRGVMDAAFSLVRDGRQTCFFASRRAPAERGELRVGPFDLEVVEPMRALRVRIAPNDTGIEADLHFAARTAAVDEGRQTRDAGGMLMMDATRFAQWGRWSGRIAVDGQALPVDPERTLGTKDRSWGIRPVGEPLRVGAPALVLPQIYFAWAPLHFDDACTHFCVFEDGSGHRWHQSGAITPAHPKPEDIPGTEDPGTRHFKLVEHAIRYVPGTRRAAQASVSLVEPMGARETIELEPLLCFQMKGIGYGHPKWRHGSWLGELEIGREDFEVAALAPLAPENVHIQQLVRARWGERTGIGILEQIALGPHLPSGFRELLDGAA